jgi:hypothetical protein
MPGDWLYKPVFGLFAFPEGLILAFPLEFPSSSEREDWIPVLSFPGLIDRHRPTYSYPLTFLGSPWAALGGEG